MKLLLKVKAKAEVVNKVGRPPKGERPMSGYERLKAYRERKKAKKALE